MAVQQKKVDKKSLGKQLIQTGMLTKGIKFRRSKLQEIKINGPTGLSHKHVALECRQKKTK